MNEAQIKQRLLSALRDAEAVLAAGGRRMTLVATPKAMRAMGLRGEVLCEHPDGRKTYSVLAHRVLEQTLLALKALRDASSDSPASEEMSTKGERHG